MATQSWQDRPIKPNKQYLQQKQKQYQTKKQIHEYLKKNNVGNKVLPCFRENIVHKKEKTEKISKQKTKAEIYQEIKLKNIEKFGDKKVNNNENIKKNIKKLDPKKMTVSYRPKKQIKIDTEQYKIHDVNKANINRAEPRQQTAKNKYQKLLLIVTKQKQQLTKQKQYFQKNKNFVEFKKYIQKQNTVPFLEQARQTIRKQKLKSSMKRKCLKSQQNQEQYKIKKSSQKKQNKNKSSHLFDPNSVSNLLNPPNPITLQSTYTKLLSLHQQKQQISDHIIFQSNIFSLNNQTKYSIQQMHTIPSIQIQLIKQYINLQTLYPQKNKYYQMALNVIQSGLHLHKNNQKQHIKYLDKNNQKQHIKQQNKSKQIKQSQCTYKRRYQGQTRITKYLSSNWLQVWTPGHQRLMTNSQLDYKVIWLNNGDIKQQWIKKKLISYYSKQKQIVKIMLKQKQPVYFFMKLNQLEQYSGEGKNKIKTIMFRNGRIVVQSEDVNIENFGG